MTTAHLDGIAEDYIRKAGARPSFKGYKGFPASICVSIDDEVVHGIPGSRVIEEGQVVSVDAGAIWQGYHGDAARTFYVGTPPADVARLIETTRLALMAGIAAAVPGAHVEDVSGAVEDVAVEGRCDIVRPYVGHGIGTKMHEDLQVPNYRTGPPRRGAGTRRLHRHRADAGARQRRHRDARRRLDGRHDGPFAGRPLRAHDRGDGERARHPDYGMNDIERESGPSWGERIRGVALQRGDRHLAGLWVLW